MSVIVPVTVPVAMPASVLRQDSVDDRLPVFVGQRVEVGAVTRHAIIRSGCVAGSAWASRTFSFETTFMLIRVPPGGYEP